MARYLDETELDRRITQLERKLEEVIEMFAEEGVGKAIREMYDCVSNTSVLIEDLHTKYVDERKQ